MGGIEILPHGSRVAAKFLHLLNDSRHGAERGQQDGPHAFHGIDLRGQQREQLRYDRVDIVQIWREFVQLGADLVHTICCLICRPQRPADGDVIAVLFPIEIIADGPKEVVEIGDRLAFPW